MILLNRSGYFVTRWRGAMRKERKFIRRSAVLSFWETSRKILKRETRENENRNSENVIMCVSWEHFKKLINGNKRAAELMGEL